MNILYLAPIVPYPLIDGDRQRCFHLLKILSERHRVHLLCFVRSQAEAEALAGLADVCQSVDAVWLKRWEIISRAQLGWFAAKPINVQSFQKKSMYKKIAKLVDEYDIEVIHAYRLRMAPYALTTRSIYRILDYTDSMTRYFQNRKQQEKSWLKQIYINHELKKLKHYEANVSNYCDSCLVSSPRDREQLLNQGSAPWIEVVSNGVDCEQIQPVDELIATPIVLFVGNMNYVPNAQGVQWFCRHCWPLIQHACPQAVFKVVGQVPKGTKGESHRRYPGAHFIGVVDDLVEELKRARVAICPLHVASGRQFKVIEYFAAQLPVVTTKLVAKNLAAQDEQHLLIADEAQYFSQQVSRLLQEDDLARSLGHAARQLAKEKYDWSVVGKKLLLLYDKLATAAQVRDNSQPGTMIDKIKKRRMLRTRRKFNG